MKLKDLIARFRKDALDTQEPYLWADDAVVAWLNEAQEQACVRGRLLLEDSRPEVCAITLVQGQHSYPLHPALYELSSVRLKGKPLSIVSREWLDNEVGDWRAYTGPASWVIQDETRLRVVGTFTASDVLQLEGYRLPMAEMADEDLDEPEIHRASHVHLVNWALHKAFSQPDADGFDPRRSAAAEAAFTAYFGPLPDSDMRRTTRKDVLHTTMLMLP